MFNDESYDDRPMYELTAEEAREQDVSNLRLYRRKSVPVAKKVEARIKGPRGVVPVLIYTPRGKGPFPVIVYFHGGGWAIGSLDTADEPASLLTNTAKAILVSVGYRLTPENKFPAAVDDCYAALVWAHAHAVELGGDPERMVVAGDSAGGNLALVACLVARDKGGPRVALQLLVYPVVDCTMRCGEARNDKQVAWFMDTYFNDPSDSSDTRASLLLADMAGLPRVALVTVEYDVLNTQCNELTRKLRAAGVKVSRRKFAGMAHGFWDTPGYLEASRRANQWLGLQVRKIR